MTSEQYQAARAIQPFLPQVKKEFRHVPEIELHPHMLVRPDVHPKNLSRTSGVRGLGAEIDTWDEFQKVYMARLLEPDVLIVNEWKALADPTDDAPSITLACWFADDKKRPIGMTFQDAAGTNDFRYSVPSNLGNWMMMNGKKYVMAYRVPFIKSWISFDPMLVSGSDILTLDHLCHNNTCHNLFHHDVTALPVNKSRSGCCPSTCKHDHMGNAKRCIIAGAFAAGIVPYL